MSRTYIIGCWNPRHLRILPAMLYTVKTQVLPPTILLSTQATGQNACSELRNSNNTNAKLVLKETLQARLVGACMPPSIRGANERGSDSQADLGYTESLRGWLEFHETAVKVTITESN